MMNAALYCSSFRIVQYAAGRPCIQNITRLTCRRYFQFCSNPAPRHCHYGSRLGTLRNSPIRSLSSKGNLSEAVVLYTYSNPKFLRMVNIFGYSFGAFWLFTSYQFSTMRIIPQSEKRTSNLPWFARFDLMSSTTSKLVAALLSSLIGCAVLSGAWIYSLRSVGKIVLGRGGKTVTFTTYNPFTFSMNKAITVNLPEVSCQGHRLTNTVVPIKIKDRWMHYLVSNEGSYHNAPLFDKTVGLRRSF
ncbi:transmembrane protein 223 [Thrips palmi]|uniref:Transmembrane protein 223 n=1 Tax=Thrips palmi TaxID=161013 RepID=A0A6P8ZX88_THRPL|nr:transmembrane protein 223 [Thrips palmi]